MENDKYLWGYRRNRSSNVEYFAMHDCDLEGAKKFIRMRRVQMKLCEPKASIKLLVLRSSDCIEEILVR